MTNLVKCADCGKKVSINAHSCPKCGSILSEQTGFHDAKQKLIQNNEREQKRTEDKQISLLQIKGIGEAKIKKLLLYFGEFEKIKNASVEELKNVLNEKDATIISNYFINLKD